MSTVEKEELLTLENVAERLMVSKQTASRIVKNHIPLIRVGGSVRVFASDFEKYLNDLRAESTPS